MVMVWCKWLGLVRWDNGFGFRLMWVSGGYGLVRYDSCWVLYRSGDDVMWCQRLGLSYGRSSM